MEERRGEEYFSNEREPKFETARHKQFPFLTLHFPSAANEPKQHTINACWGHEG
jgi:hypothetical protein